MNADQTLKGDTFACRFTNLAYRANQLHEDFPDSVARRTITNISIKSCFLALFLRGSSTHWKIARNPSIFCLRMLFFIVVLNEEWHHAAEMKNRNFKSDDPNSLAALY